MKKGNTSFVSESGLTVGIDVGDKYSHFCVLDQEGEVAEEARVATTRAALTRRLESIEPSLVVIEVGGHSRWLSRLIEELGHTCLVANAYETRQLAGARHTRGAADTASVSAPLRRRVPQSERCTLP